MSKRAQPAHILHCIFKALFVQVFQQSSTGLQLASKNEISGVYDLLENIPVKDNAIRGDAIFCRKKLYSRIVERAGDFIFVAKGNQKALFTGIQKSFPLAPECYDRAAAQNTAKPHGRFEMRVIKSVEHRLFDWPGIR